MLGCVAGLTLPDVSKVRSSFMLFMNRTAFIFKGDTALEEFFYDYDYVGICQHGYTA